MVKPAEKQAPQALLQKREPGKAAVLCRRWKEGFLLQARRVSGGEFDGVCKGIGQ
jgi:hypothetical protein